MKNTKLSYFALSTLYFGQRRSFGGSRYGGVVRIRAPGAQETNCALGVFLILRNTVLIAIR